MGRTNDGMLASRASAAAVQRIVAGSAARPRRSSPRSESRPRLRAPRYGGRAGPRAPSFAGHHRGERASGAACCGAGAHGSRRASIRTNPHAERLDDLRFVGIGQHRHLVAALGTGIDDRERAALGRIDGLQLHRGVAGDTKELHRGISADVVDSRLSRSCCATCSRARPTAVSGNSARAVPVSHRRASSGSNGTAPRQGISRSAALV